MKKIIALTLCLFMFLSLSACGGSSGSGFTGVDHSNSPKDPADPINAEIQSEQNENQNGNQNNNQNNNESKNENSAGLPGNLSGKSSEMTAGFVKAMSAIDNGKAMKTDWPASDFPAGYPVYPDGEVVYTEYFFDKDLLIFITGTGRTAYDSYIGTLRTDGWIFVDIDDEDEGEFAVKGTWSISISYYEDYGVGIYVSDTGYDVESLYAEYKWPDSLPTTIPVYPDGKIAFVIGDDDSGVYTIMVTGSSKAELENYISKLTGLGWTLEDNGDFMLTDENGVWYLTAEYENEDATVSIMLLYMEKYDFGLSEDELSLLENGQDGGKSDAEWPDDEFTRLIPKPDFEFFTAGSSADTFTAIFYNITVAMIKDYAEKVKAAGFTVDPDTAETDTTYTYTASNGNGYTAALKLFSGETLYIIVEKK